MFTGPYAPPILNINVDVELHSIRSFEPKKQNATKALRLLLNMAKKHNITIGLRSGSESVYFIPSEPARIKHVRESSQEERKYFYFRALLMYQRVGFRPVNDKDFIKKVNNLEPVLLIAG